MISLVIYLNILGYSCVRGNQEKKPKSLHCITLSFTPLTIALKNLNINIHLDNDCVY